MSLSRDAAIQHFLARKYADMTIGEAYAAAPVAARNGLHEQDASWIKRFGNVPAHDAVKRLVIRSRGNPNGLSIGPGRPSEGKTARMELRLTPQQKLKATERGGSAWVLALIDAAP
jgi:hypothetical protein